MWRAKRSGEKEYREKEKGDEEHIRLCHSLGGPWLDGKTEGVGGIDHGLVDEWDPSGVGRIRDFGGVLLSAVVFDYTS